MTVDLQGAGTARGGLVNLVLVPPLGGSPVNEAAGLVGYEVHLDGRDLGSEGRWFDAPEGIEPVELQLTEPGTLLWLTRSEEASLLEVVGHNWEPVFDHSVASLVPNQGYQGNALALKAMVRRVGEHFSIELDPASGQVGASDHRMGVDIEPEASIVEDLRSAGFPVGPVYFGAVPSAPVGPAEFARRDQWPARCAALADSAVAAPDRTALLKARVAAAAAELEPTLDAVGDPSAQRDPME